MARPLFEGLLYFPHDVDLSSDDKFKIVEKVHGLIGYAVILKLYELIYKTGNGELIFDESLIESYSILWDVQVDNLQAIVKTATKCRLLSIETTGGQPKITSNGIKKRLKAIHEQREKWRTVKKAQRAHQKSSNETKPLENCPSGQPLDNAQKKKKIENRIKISADAPKSRTKIKPRFSPEGKTQILPYVYLTKEEYESLLLRFQNKGLDIGDLKFAIKKLNNYFERNQDKRQWVLSDFEQLQDWPLDEAIKRKTNGLKLETQQVYLAKAETSILGGKNE